MQHRSLVRRPSRTLISALLFSAAFTGLISATTVSHAYDENSPSPINVDEQRVMLKGYDVVAYFASDTATLGSSAFSATHDGAVYHFASAANRDAFKSDPEKYAPQFGGFCAMGVANGIKLDTDPTLFRVVDGKLYVNVNQKVQTRWLDDPQEFIERARAKWPNIVDKAPKDLTPG